MSAPHDAQPILTAGAPLSDATGAVVLVHGRGASAHGILSLAAEFDRPGLAYLAPQAASGSWYPNSFLAPIEANEPGLSSGIAAVGRAVGRARDAGVARIAVGGFSQGACLALEYAVRHPSAWTVAFGLSGGLIGTGPGPASAPPLAGMGGTHAEKAFDYGHLGETPLAEQHVFLGCSDVDPHIPLRRVDTTAEGFRQLGAEVDQRVYRGFGHTVNQDEVEAVRALLAAM